MDEKQLMKDFCLVSGLDEQQAEGWKPLVLGCWKELCRRLRPAVQPQEHRERLSLASVQRWHTIVCRGCKERCTAASRWGTSR